MDILIFDMDGVLLKPLGYHRALKETVRLAGISTGFGEVLLADEQIAQFEALGISSEWHSSALCMAVMALEKQKGIAREEDQAQPVILDLEDLFVAITDRPMQDSALSRGLAAIEGLVVEANVPADLVCWLVAQSESIRHSPTKNWFQELVLGSEDYTRTYQKKPQFETESYLKLYDERLLNEPQTERVLRWTDMPDHGAAIMTRRPSSGPPGFAAAPDANMGALLVGLEDLPLVGYGEICWLAAQTGREVKNLSKPAWEHALAAILVASGWSLERSLTYVGKSLSEWEKSDFQDLNSSTIIVFEDTLGGMIAVQEAVDLLNIMGLRVKVQKIGIAEEVSKQSALYAQGATVYPNINQALENLNCF